MALIYCPNCGKQISDKAEKCVHCGVAVHLYPLVNKDNKVVSQKNNGFSDGTIPLVIGLIVFVIVIIVGLWFGGVFDSFIQVNQTSKSIKNVDQIIQDAENEINKHIDNFSKNIETEQPKKVDQTALKIVSNIYSWYEDGNYASISFQYDGDPLVGTMTLTGNILTLELLLENDRNAIDVAVNPNSQCSFFYKYEIRGTYIHLKFKNSSCGYEAMNRMLPYNESCNCITATSGSGEMTFR